MSCARHVSAIVAAAAFAVAAVPATAKSFVEVIEATEKGQLKNPHAGDKAAAEAGHKLYMAAGCNGCHGGTGGGGMGPPLTNPVWIYGNDEDTLFRLIALGSQDLAKAGYTRKGTEAVMGPMPPFKDIVKSEDDLWKIVTWITSLSTK